MYKLCAYSNTNGYPIGKGWCILQAKELCTKQCTECPNYGNYSEMVREGTIKFINGNQGSCYNDVLDMPHSPYIQKKDAKGVTWKNI